MIWKLIVILFLACFISSDASASLPATIHSQNNIILITLDGVRWQDLFEGLSPSGQKVDSPNLFPNIYHYFVDNGVAFGKESEVRTFNFAHVSQPGYLEIMTGSMTTCIDNTCPPNLKPTLINQFRSAAVFSSWDRISYVVNDFPILNTGRSYRNKGWYDLGLPDQRSFPIVWNDREYRPDSFTAKAALEYYNHQHPQFFWISFCDTDEYAHAGDYAGYIKALQFADQFIGYLMKIIPLNTTVIISPDHGRNKDWRFHGWELESGRVFILMSGNGVSASGFVKVNHTLHLTDIYPTAISIRNHQFYSSQSLLSQY